MHTESNTFVRCIAGFAADSSLIITSPKGGRRCIDVAGAAVDSLSAEQWNKLVALYDRAIAHYNTIVDWDKEQLEMLHELKPEARKSFLMELPEYAIYMQGYRKRFDYQADRFYLDLTVEEMMLIKDIA